ncbi:MAG: LacI family DNA-binding transcriptional regulator, partial [Phycisphaerales bacterium]
VDHPRVDSILVDNAAGTREAVEHLLSTIEPQNLFFVGGPAENFDTRRRAETFKEILRQRPPRARADQVSFGRYDVQWGREWVADRLSRHGPTALNGCGVLAANDEIALGILQAAQDSGVAVPKALKIVGFDDTRLASLVRPTLSTVRVPLAEIGAAAVAALIRRIEEPSKDAVRTRLLTRLIVRESSAKK